MSTFHFRLETLLRLRRREEERRQRALAERRMRIADCVRREEALRREFDGVLASANPERGGEIDPALREERWSYLSALDAVVQQTREERRTLEDEAAVMEDRLRMAVRDRRILETLKEARLAAHRDAGRRREAKRMDFLATTTRREAAL